MTVRPDDLTQPHLSGLVTARLIERLNGRNGEGWAHAEEFVQQHTPEKIRARRGKLFLNKREREALRSIADDPTRRQFLWMSGSILAALGGTELLHKGTCDRGQVVHLQEKRKTAGREEGERLTKEIAETSKQANHELVGGWGLVGSVPVMLGKGIYEGLQDPKDLGRADYTDEADEVREYIDTLEPLLRQAVKVMEDERSKG